ncbi:hypothetical protein CAP36_09205 [Chitinophagaceae bacterium IBVUCB2]|nr:hypothetical protein CAP36_09205 [Chitinophagaceae bacterium IBVUCB2]
MSEPIINKVAESGLVTIDLETWYPKGETAVFDMKDYLFMGLILKEKDFREALKKVDWSVFANKNMALTCTADAIIPVWAYMLVAAYLQPVAAEIVMGDEKELHKTLFLKNLSVINVNDYTDKRIVIKGCGETPIADYVYMEITKLLRPVVKSIMYGEPCSTVPVYKKPLPPKSN